MIESKRRAFGRRLRTARIARGWSQEMLAIECGVQRLAVGRWEAGEQTPSFEARKQLAVIFGDTLLGKPSDWVPAIK